MGRWLALAAISLAGLGASGYLTYSRYADRPAECAGIGSCHSVQTSEYSEVLGVPVALMGALFFAALLLLALVRMMSGRESAEWADPVAFAMTLGGVVFVAYLTYVELFVIDAVCPWCVGVAVAAVLSFVVVGSGIVSASRSDGGQY